MTLKPLVNDRPSQAWSRSLYFLARRVDSSVHRRCLAIVMEARPLSNVIVSYVATMLSSAEPIQRAWYWKSGVHLAPTDGEKEKTGCKVGCGESAAQARSNLGTNLYSATRRDAALGNCLHADADGQMSSWFYSWSLGGLYIRNPCIASFLPFPISFLNIDRKLVYSDTTVRYLSSSSFLAQSRL